MSSRLGHRSWVPPPLGRRARSQAAAALLVVLAACSTSDAPKTDANPPTLATDATGSTSTLRTETPPTGTGLGGERPPLRDLAVAVTLDEVHVIDTRTGAAVHRVNLAPALGVDGRSRILEFVTIAPDKNTAVVTATENGGSRYSLWTVDLRTDTVTRLSDDAIWPAFSPDGTTLAYTRSQGPREGGDTIVLRDLATGRERQLVRRDVRLEISGLSRISTTVWSPDNRTLAYNFGYYGADTYLIDTATATDLDTARRLDNVYFIDWRDPDTALVAWFCCAEAEPAVVSTYRISTGDHRPAGLPELLGFIDRNDQDTRLAGRGLSTSQYVVRYTTTGELVTLPGYRHLSW